MTALREAVLDVKHDAQEAVRKHPGICFVIVAIFAVLVALGISGNAPLSDEAKNREWALATCAEHHVQGGWQGCLDFIAFLGELGRADRARR